MRITKILPSRMCSKNFTAANTASSSPSYVLYLVSVGESFREKNPTGFHSSFYCCSNDAPMAVFDASVVNLNGAFVSRNAFSVAEATLFLHRSNASVDSGVHGTGRLSFFFESFRNSFSGACFSARLGTHRR